jgi:hypothetical protein
VPKRQRIQENPHIQHKHAYTKDTMRKESNAFQRNSISTPL